MLSVKNTTAFALIALVITGLVMVSYLSFEQAAKRERLVRTQELIAEHIDVAEAAFETIPVLTTDEKRRLRQFLNPIHLEYAGTYGIDRLEDEVMADSLVRRGDLVQLAANAYYRIAPLDYSEAVVVPHAAHLLNRIGQRFHDELARLGLPPFRFVISSVTRTTENQEALRRINGNAASLSAHEFGTTLDLLYNRFDYHGPTAALPAPDESLRVDADEYVRRMNAAYRELAEDYPSRLKALLGRVLLNLQADGDVVAVYERRQPVYHITVADSVPPAGPRVQAAP